MAPACGQARLISAKPLSRNVLPAAAHFSRFGEAAVSPARRQMFERRLRMLAASPRSVAVAVALPDGTMWSGATAGGAAPRFHAASVVKPFAVVIARQLIGEGALSESATIDRWYPDVPNASLITIADLFQHTSGLATPRDTEEIGTYTPLDARIAQLTAADVKACPGQAWAYSNIGYLILGGIIERVERAPFAQVLDRRIARPLKLGATFVPLAGKPVAGVLPGFDKGVPVAASDYAAPHAAGSLVSTPTDLIRFWRGVLGGKLVSPAGREAMVGRFVDWTGNPRLAYGQGTMAYVRPGANGAMLGHSGSIVGFNSILVYAPREDAFIAVMTNDRAQSADDVLAGFLDDLAAPGQPTSRRDPPAFTQASMDHLRFLEGRWSGTAPDGSVFYEAYDRPDPLTLRSRRYKAGTFAEVTDGSIVALKDGEITLTWGKYSWRATGIANGLVTFEPVNAPSAFSWRRVDSGNVEVLQRWIDEKGAAQSYTVRLQRVASR